MNWIYIVLVLVILYILRKLNTTRIILFHTDGCSPCAAMMGEWAKFKSMVRFNILRPIDITERKITMGTVGVAKDYGVKDLPYIIKINTRGTREPFNKELTSGALLAWATDN